MTFQVWASGSCAQVRADLRPRLAMRISEAEQRSNDLSAFVATLQRALEHLDALPDRAGRCNPQCGFPGPRPSGSAAPVPVVLHRTRQDAEWRTAPVACSLTGADVQERAAQWRILRRRTTADVMVGNTSDGPSPLWPRRRRCLISGRGRSRSYGP